MFSELKKRIKNDKPFSKLFNIGDIVTLFNYGDLEINGRLLFYGVSLRIKDSTGKFYKLRVYSSVETAVRQEGLILLIPHILPKFYGRDRNYLLFEFLQGRLPADNENPDIFFKIGKMCGEVNNLKDNKEQELKERYYQKINCFFKQGIVSYQNYQEILRIYRKLIRDIKYEVVLGFNDLQKCNFIIDHENKIYFVDEDALEYNIKGYGFDNVISRFYYGYPAAAEFEEEYTKAFFLGYNSLNSSIFLNQDYKKFSFFLFTIDNTLYFLRIGKIKNMEYQLKRLFELEW